MAVYFNDHQFFYLPTIYYCEKPYTLVQVDLKYKLNSIGWSFISKFLTVLYNNHFKWMVNEYCELKIDLQSIY